MIGTVDEVTSILGVLKSAIEKNAKESKDNEIEKEFCKIDEIVSEITDIQNVIFRFGSSFCFSDEKYPYKIPCEHNKDGNYICGVCEADKLYNLMTKYEKDLPPLKKFIIPGGCMSASVAHYARTVTRRLEREVISYQEKLSPEERHFKIIASFIPFCNRLSDYLFIIARVLNKALANGVEQTFN